LKIQITIPCYGEAAHIGAVAREIVALGHKPVVIDDGSPDDTARAAREAGVRFAISTDSHSVDGFRNMRFGIGQARRAWLTADDVINTRPLRELRKLLKRA